MNSINSSKSIYIVMTSEVDKKNASKIAYSLLEDKLVACVSFKNIESHFWWEGKINQLKEVQLIVKCKEENLQKVCKKIHESHSYELPEIIYFLVSSHEKYHQWINSF